MAEHFTIITPTHTFHLSPPDLDAEIARRTYRDAEDYGSITEFPLFGTKYHRLLSAENRYGVPVPGEQEIIQWILDHPDEEDTMVTVEKEMQEIRNLNKPRYL